MIVDYPILHEVPWIPKGKQKNVPYAFFETQPVEIPEVTSADAPVVVEVAYNDSGRSVHRQDEEAPPEHVVAYRKIGNGWYKPKAVSSGGISAAAIAADPLVLNLVGKGGNYDIARNNGYFRGDRSQVVIAEGQINRIASRAELPEGKYGHVPPGYAEDDGRSADARKAAARLVLVDGVVHVPTFEPVLRLQVDFAGRARFHKIEVVPYDPSKGDQGLLHPVSDLLRLDAFDREQVRADRADHEHHYGLPSIAVRRPDLLDFDSTPNALQQATITCLRGMKENLIDRSAFYFSAFAELRDQFAPGTAGWSKNITEFRIDPDMDQNARYVCLVRCIQAHLTEAARPESYGQPDYESEHGIYRATRSALAMTRYAEHFDGATLSLAVRQGYVRPPAEYSDEMADEPEEEDLVAIVQQPRIAGPRP